MYIYIYVYTHIYIYTHVYIIYTCIQYIYIYIYPHINAHNIFTFIFLGVKRAKNVCLCRRSIAWLSQHLSFDRCCQGPLKLLQV